MQVFKKTGLKTHRRGKTLMHDSYKPVPWHRRVLNHYLRRTKQSLAHLRQLVRKSLNQHEQNLTKIHADEPSGRLMTALDDIRSATGNAEQETGQSSLEDNR